MRVGLLKKNIFIAIFYQLVVAISGLILPRVVLESYGSEVNGILQTINQFLNYVTILECGIGGVILASLYSPIAKGDKEAISDIVLNTKNTFKKLSYVYIAFIVILSAILGFIIESAYNALFIGSLVLIMGITVYFNYYIAIAETLLIKADQKLYILQTAQIITTILNVIISIIVMRAGANVQFVKILTLLIFLINPIWLRSYAKKHYHINNKMYDENRIYPKKKEGFIHHIAYFVHRNTDIVILSVVCGAKIVSVYSIYYSIVLILENFLSAISNAIIGFIGNLTATENKAKLKQTFEIYQGINTYITFVFSTVAAIMIIPFVSIYTKGITDVNYIQPVFAFLLIVGQLIYCLRIPFSDMITAKGHYKETKIGAYFEVISNVVISLILVKPYGLNGVAVGTLIGMSLRTVYLVWYLSKNIINRSIWIFGRDFLLNIAVSAIFLLISKQIGFECQSILVWIIYALIVGIIVSIVLFILNVLINKELKIYIINVFTQKNK